LHPACIISFVEKNMNSFFSKKCCLLIITGFILTSMLYGQHTATNIVLLPSKKYTVPFTWMHDSVNGIIEPHAAMLIPVKLPNCSKQFYMQFDMGAPNTIFYQPKLRAISEKYPAFYRVDDSTRRLAAMEIAVGKNKVMIKEPGLLDFAEKTIDWSANKKEIIGTIGSDWLENRTVLIDYPQQQIILNYTVPAKLENRLTDFSYIQRNILIPVIIKGKKTMLYFDTGSSAFALLTSKETAISMAGANAVASRYPVKSWGRTLYANSLATTDSVELSQLTIPIHTVTYMDGASEEQVNRMLKLGIGGMTGNKLFLHTGLVLDTRNKKFLLIPSK
jgi:hypothetical protein